MELDIKISEMALAQFSCNQRSVERIKFMVVDHDHVFLQTLKHMLENSTFRVSDSWVLESTVLEIGDSKEALSTLKTQRNDIDFIITDYDMPGMNGVQLKREIKQELGNIPVMIMSSDIKNQEESLACGAIGFIQKPIDPSDIPTIFHFALTSKKKGKSILSTENKHKDKEVSVVPKQINLSPDPEQTEVLMIMDKESTSMSESVNNTNGGCVSPNGSNKDLKREPNGGPSDDDESLTRPVKKTKIFWDQRLQNLFLKAIDHIGAEVAKPKNILEFMNVPNLTTKHIASHLQKYRRKVNVLKSNFPAAHIKEEPYFNTYTPTIFGSETSPNNSSSYSTPGHGLGQRRPDIPEPVYFNQMPPNNYMNRSFTHEPIGSETNLRFPEQAVNPNKIGQTSQVLGFGLPGQSGFSGNSFNNNMMSNYGPFTPNQSGTDNFLYGMQPFLSNENVAYNPQPHVYATAQPDLILTQFANLNLYGDLSNTNNMSNFHIDHNKGPCNGERSNTFVVPEMKPPSFNMNPNQNQVYSSGETSSTVLVPETNSPSFNLNPNHNEGHSNGEISKKIIIRERTPPSFNMKPNQNQGHSTEETSNTFVVEETKPQFFNMNPNQNQVYSNEETSNTFVVEETKPPFFNMNPNQNQGHYNGERSNPFIIRERTPPSFNMNLNQNQGHSNEETSNIFVVEDTKPPFFNMNPNQNQEQDNDPDFMCLSSLDPEELLGVDFMNSLFNNDIKWEEFS